MSDTLDEPMFGPPPAGHQTDSQINRAGRQIAWFAGIVIFLLLGLAASQVILQLQTHSVVAGIAKAQQNHTDTLNAINSGTAVAKTAVKEYQGILNQVNTASNTLIYYAEQECSINPACTLIPPATG